MHFPHLDIINQPLPRKEFIFHNSYVTLDVAHSDLLQGHRILSTKL